MFSSTKIAEKRQQRSKSAMDKGKTPFLIGMLVLPVVQWLIFWLAVNLSSITLAFQDQRTEAWTLENFVTFWNSLTSPYEEIGIALKNTLIYFAANVLVIIPLSLIISYFIYKKILGYKGFRIIFYLPAIISSVAMVRSYENFISPSGPLGTILEALGNPLPPEGLLGRASTATWTIVVYYIWTGFASNIILFGGVMTRIPLEVLESARLDGCGAWRELCLLILPLIWSNVSTMIIFTFTGIFNAGGPILLFTGGKYDTATLNFWIFKPVYGEGVHGVTGTYNLVSCAGLCFTLIGVPIILFVRWLSEKIPSVEY